MRRLWMNFDSVPGKWRLGISSLLTVALVMLVVVAVMVKAQTQAQRDIAVVDDVTDLGPDVVIMDELQELYTTVPFEHRLHAQMAEMWGGCETCHHRHPNPSAPNITISDIPHNQDESAEIPACKSCHMIGVGEPSEDIRMPFLKGAYHRQCLNCHRDWSGANNCNICHKPISGEDGLFLIPEPTADDVLGRMHPPIKEPVEKVYSVRFKPVAGELAMFRHEEHVKRFGLTCVECHYQDSCASCHSPQAEIGTHKVLQAARTWQESHDPCIGCHMDQACSHCHYSEGKSQPARFEHRSTGQTLDDDHKDIECRRCHKQPHFRDRVTCTEADCHNPELVINYPNDKPGPIVETAIRENLAIIKVKSPVAVQLSNPTIIKSIPRELQRWRLHINNYSLAMNSKNMEKKYAIVETAPVPKLVNDAASESVPELAAAPINVVKMADCTTPECHANLKNTNFVHGPVNVNACDSCHLLVEPVSHKFELQRNKEDLCTYCHEFDADVMPFLHEPVARGECLGCHDTHGGNSHGLLREDTVIGLCDRCHESVTETHDYLHTPVKNGDCLSCHPPHASLYPKLLNSVGPDLCLTCHTEFDRLYSQVKYTHKAVEKGCFACHDAHGSAHPLSLAYELTDLCRSCHDAVDKSLTQDTYQHSVTTSERACLNCHTPHGSDLAAMLNDLPINSCMECHDKAVETADGRVIEGVPEISDPKMMMHGPLKEGLCSGCHTPHASNQPHLLGSAIAGNFYEYFSPAKYELCFGCHNSQIAEGVIGTEVTNFRNGELNLHYLHVRGQLWGRNCLVCHLPHASTQAPHLRDTVPFGKWQVPINFLKTETGGSCAAGCHYSFAYDRVNPAPLTMRSISQLAVEDMPTNWAREIRFDTFDIHNQKIQIPLSDRPSVLIFLRPDTETQADVFSLLAAARGGEGDKIQTVLIISGSEACNFGEALDDAQTGFDIPVCVDEELNLCNELDVHAWPFVLLVNHEGTEVVRLGGPAASLALRLPAYIQWVVNSDGKTIPPDMLHDDSHPLIVTDGSARQQRWYEQRSRKLLELGNVKAAQDIIDTGLRHYPDDWELQILKIEVLIASDQVKQAVKMYDQLAPDTALPASQKAVLNARLLIAQKYWDEAKLTLLELVAKDPQLAPAYFLLGQIYEHDQDWQKASEAYRLASEATRH